MRDIAFQREQTLGRIQQKQDHVYCVVAGLNTVQGSTVSRYLLTSLPFCVRFNVAVTRHAATLDTGPVANSYPRGIRTHLFSNHFQYARASDGLPL